VKLATSATNKNFERMLKNFRTSVALRGSAPKEGHSNGTGHSSGTLPGATFRYLNTVPSIFRLQF
jgi:hypothetical protein